MANFIKKLQFLSKSLRKKVATITHFYSMLGLVAGKSCNLWVSCIFRVLQLVSYRLYLTFKCFGISSMVFFMPFDKTFQGVTQLAQYNTQRKPPDEQRKCVHFKVSHDFLRHVLHVTSPRLQNASTRICLENKQICVIRHRCINSLVKICYKLFLNFHP